MADEVTVTVADVRPLNTAVIIRGKALEALAFGDAVCISTATGDLPNFSKADAAAIDADYVAVGIVVATTPDNPGATTVAAGDPCDVVIRGEVTGYLAMTPGQTIWLSDTVGRLSTVVSASTSMVMGVAKSAATLIVNCGYYLRAS